MGRELQFSFDGAPVGYFEEPSYPREPGEYRYMPFRGIGHYNLVRALAEGPALCRFVDMDYAYEFWVSSRPRYGVLAIEKIVLGPALPG